MDKATLEKLIAEDEFGLLKMYYVYGKEKFEDKYRPVNIHKGEFVNRRLHASLFNSWLDADRACYLLEKENPGFTFETREA